MKKCKSICFLITGMIMLISSLWIYLPEVIKDISLLGELTFLSNFLSGILFFIGGIRGFLRKKDFSRTLYLNATMVLTLVMVVATVFDMNRNFSLFFLHIINPIIGIIMFLLFTSKEEKYSNKRLFTSLIFPTLYLAYAISYGYLFDVWMYGFINIPQKGLGFMLIFTIISGLLILLISLVLCLINDFIQKRIHIL